MSALVLLGCFAAGGWLFLHSVRFGALPQGNAQDRLRQSPRYAGEAFQNELPTPVLTAGKGFIATYIEFLFAKTDNAVPPAPVPSIKTPLKTLDRHSDVVIRLGHSSFFIQLEGRRILIDPVLSGYASPVFFSTRTFAGSAPYAEDDLPAIDVLLISHDHWDHLDYPTLSALRPRIGTVVCGLGVGSHLRRWGFSDARIQDGDRGDAVTTGGLTIRLTPARHYSGRTFTRNKTLWTGFVLETPRTKLFFSGDSGYGPHFADLGKRFGAFDLVMLDCGQYNERWGLIHMMPEEAARAAEDLRAKALLPAHAGKFSIACHSWDEPYRRIAAASRGRSYRLVTPLIGEMVSPTDEDRDFGVWWEEGGERWPHGEK